MTWMGSYVLVLMPLVECHSLQNHESDDIRETHDFGHDPISPRQIDRDRALAEPLLCHTCVEKLNS